EGPVVTLPAAQVQAVDTPPGTGMNWREAVIALTRPVDCQSWIRVASSTQIELGGARAPGSADDLTPGTVLRAKGMVSYDKQHRGTLLASEIVITTAAPRPAATQ